MSFPHIIARRAGGAPNDNPGMENLVPVAIPDEGGLGDYLVAIVIGVSEGILGSMTVNSTHSGPGWTGAAGALNSSTQMGVFAKVSDGDDALWLNVNTGVNRGAGAAVTLRVQNATDISASSLVVSDNPPNLTPPGIGVADILWITACGRQNEDAPTGWPAGYGNFTSGDDGGYVGCSMHSADRLLRIDSQNPESFLFGSGATAGSFTIALWDATNRGSFFGVNF